MADVIVKKNDTAPALPFTCLDPATGTALNLTGATVTFVMRSVTANTPLVNAAATIVSAPAGTVSYTFTATDTAIAGEFIGEFHVTFGTGGTYSSGMKLTCPTDGYLDILIEEDTITNTPIARLVQLGEVKDHLNIPSSNRTQDAELLRLVDAVTPIVENITGPIIQRVYVETYDGGQWFISVRHRPIVSVQRVVEYRGPIAYDLTQISTNDFGTIYSYHFEPVGRIVRRTVGGGVTPFPPGPDAVWVTYTAGQQNVPANVRYATFELIRVNWQQTQQGGRPTWGSASSLGDDYSTGVQMMGFFVPNRVREMLAPSRRHPSIA